VSEFDRELHLEAFSSSALDEVLIRGPDAGVIERGGWELGDQRAEVGDLGLELGDRVAYDFG
jgi:hypothetical protein